MPFLTRRELTLFLFCLIVFLLSYNYTIATHTSRLRLHGASDALSRSAASLLGLGGASGSARGGAVARSGLRADGRRLPEFVDQLELEIVGDWEAEKRPVYDLSPHGLTVDGARRSWRLGDQPDTKVLGHVPGFTIADDVYVVNGTLFFVSDRPVQFPRADAMVTPGGEQLQVRFVGREDAGPLFGTSVLRIVGTTILCNDALEAIDNNTFIALHRAYAHSFTLPPLPHLSALPRPSPSPPPDRTVFTLAPQLRFTQTGYPLALARAVQPYTALWHAEDWADLARTAQGALLDRVVVADRRAALAGAPTFDFGALAARAAQEQEHAKGMEKAKAKGWKEKTKEVTLTSTPIEATDKRLAFAPPFALPAPAGWWAPVRDALADHVALSPLQPGSKSSSKPKPPRGVTYISTQHRLAGARLRDADHARLVAELEKLGKAQAVAVRVVEVGDVGSLGGVGAARAWREQMRAAVRSSVMLGVYGDALTSSAFMPVPSRSGSPAPTVIEFFPDSKFTNEQEFLTRSVGIDYVAWRNTKNFQRGSLPPISPPEGDGQVISVDVGSVIQTVRDLLKRQ